MNKAALPLVVLTWIGCQVVFGLTDLSDSLLNSFTEGKPKYPSEWIEKCGNKDGEIPLIQTKFEEFTECAHREIDVFSLQENFEKARNDSQVSKFTKNECSKFPRALDCLNNFVQSIQHCFDSSQKETAWTLVRIVRAVQEFICYRDGERVLIFLKDDGGECFTEQKDDLYLCANDTTLEDLSNVTTKDIGYLFGINFNEKSCRHLISVSDCLFNTLRKCKDRTPSNLLSSLTKKMFKETPCWKYHPASSAQNIIVKEAVLILSVALSLAYLKMA